MRLGAGDANPHRTALALRDIAGRLRSTAPEAAEAITSAASALEALEVPSGSIERPMTVAGARRVSA
jgi:hypothetical protein